MHLRSGRRMVLPAIAVAIAVLLACASGDATQSDLDATRTLRGALVAAETTFVGMHGRYAAYRVRLTSATGLVATGRVLRPARGVRIGRYPAVLLNDGRELNSRAVDYLPPDFGDVVVLSLDYPSALPYDIDLRAVVTRTASLRRAARRIAPSFSLGAAYLAQRNDVDSSRIALVASSFAVPFGVIAAAADTRFRNVALIYGAGDLARVLTANLDVRPLALRRAAAWLAMRPFADLAPERYVGRIAPRQVVMVNGVDDPQMPRPAVEALYAAAREPKSLIWLRTGHLEPGDTALIRALVDTALARLPVLREPAPAAVPVRGGGPTPRSAGPAPPA